eukprot:GHVR01097446.1.p1 GENE.GHVR01097446.1~~GHVR01097446.1.p1  ORF type:complete len:347 (-),score=4.08 GHVR01097446.1:196-1236(-)
MAAGGELYRHYQNSPKRRHQADSHGVLMKYQRVLIILTIVLSCPTTHALAEDVKVSTYYPSPSGDYKHLEVDEVPSAMLTDYTQSLVKDGIDLATTYTSGTYTPGLFWSTSDNNATKPKAGIWSYLDATNVGSSLYFGTSNDYTTGITNTALVINPAGYVGIGTTNPQYKLDVNGNLSVNGKITVTGSSPSSAGVVMVQPVTLDTSQADYQLDIDRSFGAHYVVSPGTVVVTLQNVQAHGGTFLILGSARFFKPRWVGVGRGLFYDTVCLKLYRDYDTGTKTGTLLDTWETDYDSYGWLSSGASGFVHAMDTPPAGTHTYYLIYAFTDNSQPNKILQNGKISAVEI